MLAWLRNLASQSIKFPGLKYGAPKLMYPPEEQANKPVVILFGWLGASERHLAKYTKLYQDKGYETIHYIPPMSIIAFPHKIPEMNAQIQGELVKIMREKQLLKRPFLLHLFSNSGYINWCYFQKHIQKSLPNNAFNIYYKIHGTVIDSAPCKLDPEVLSRGFLGALLPKARPHPLRTALPHQNYAISILAEDFSGTPSHTAPTLDELQRQRFFASLTPTTHISNLIFPIFQIHAFRTISDTLQLPNHRHWLYTPIFEKFWDLYIHSPLNAKPFETTNKMIDNTILPFPQFYMFSEGDTMIYAKEIKSHISRIQRKARLPIQSVDFVTSDHVAHYRTHPAAYSKRIDAVLSRVEMGWITLMKELHLHGSAPLIKSSKSLRKKIKKHSL